MKVFSFIKPIIVGSKKKILRNAVKTNVNPLNGIELGLPLNIFSNVYTNIHYGYDITTSKSFLLQFLIGYYTYGKDRFYDALDYEKDSYETSKKELYDNYIAYKNLYSTSFLITFVIISGLLLNDEYYFNNIPFIILLQSTEYYKELKRNIGILKPVYVSIMWTFSSIVLPCVLHDHNFSILHYPLDLLPPTLTLFASSNIADCKDIEEDKKEGIQTIPVVLGQNKSNMISLFALALSSLLFGLNQHYLDRPIINSFIELQNAGTSFVPYFMMLGNNTNISL